MSIDQIHEALALNHVEQADQPAMTERDWAEYVEHFVEVAKC